MHEHHTRSTDGGIHEKADRSRCCWMSRAHGCEKRLSENSPYDPGPRADQAPPVGTIMATTVKVHMKSILRKIRVCNMGDTLQPAANDNDPVPSVDAFAQAIAAFPGQSAPSRPERPSSAGRQLRSLRVVAWS
jgi:hypothetical protein